eukprot:1186794-Prorocentrum_minimum.AAC.5
MACNSSTVELVDRPSGVNCRSPRSPLSKCSGTVGASKSSWRRCCNRLKSNGSTEKFGKAIRVRFND